MILFVSAVLSLSLTSAWAGPLPRFITAQELAKVPMGRQLLEALALRPGANQEAIEATLKAARLKDPSPELQSLLRRIRPTLPTPPEAPASPLRPTSAAPTLELKAAPGGFEGRAQTLAQSAVGAARVRAARKLSFRDDASIVPRFALSEPAPRVYHLEFPTQREAASTMMRFQEAYEGKIHRGTTFSRRDFKRFYASEHDGRFTYFEDWNAFNVPGSELEPFYQGRFGKLTAGERAVLKTFEDIEGPFAIIATVKGDALEMLEHELSHGLFATNPSYKAEVLEVLQGIDADPIRIVLRDDGYHDAVLVDEVHGYLLTFAPYLEERGVDVVPYGDAILSLKEIYRKYLPPAAQ